LVITKCEDTTCFSSVEFHLQPNPAKPEPNRDLFFVM
jgi:hypothetical protein